MKALTIFVNLLAVYLASAFKLRGLANDTIQQQQENEAGVYSRIFNGHFAEDIHFRYQVGLRSYRRQRTLFTCGGSLISLYWVLTAAHCVFGCESVSVYLGSITFAEPEKEYHIGRGGIVEHMGYRESTLIHDIALIRIPEQQISDTITTIRLPPNHHNLPSYAGLWAVLAGWGRTSDSTTDNSPVLKYSGFQVIENSDCEEIYGTNRIYKGKLCTHTTQASACPGDSGSPLAIVKDDGFPIQIGIFSFFHGHGCEKHYANAYTRVGYYLDWINQQMRRGG